MGSTGIEGKRHRLAITLDKDTEAALAAMQRRTGIGTIARTAAACVRIVSAAFADRGRSAPYDEGYGLTDEVGALFRHYANWELQPDGTRPAVRRKDNGDAILYGDAPAIGNATRHKADDDNGADTHGC